MATGEQPSFGRLVIRLAWGNTWAFFKHRSVEAFAGLLSLGIGIPIFLYLYGWSGVKEEVVRFGAFVLAPGGLFLFLAFLWNLFLASDQLVYDAIKKIPTVANATEKPAAASPPKRVPVKWEIWKARSKYTISEFAAILAKIDPISMRSTPDKEAYVELLLEEVEAKKLEHITEFDVNSFDGRRYEKSIDDNTSILKEVAISWAESKSFDTSHIK